MYELNSEGVGREDGEGCMGRETTYVKAEVGVPEA